MDGKTESLWKKNNKNTWQNVVFYSQKICMIEPFLVTVSILHTTSVNVKYFALNSVGVRNFDLFSKNQNSMCYLNRVLYNNKCNSMVCACIMVCSRYISMNVVCAGTLGLMPWTYLTYPDLVSSPPPPNIPQSY